MKIVEQPFSFPHKIENDTTHISKDIPSELTGMYKHQLLAKILYYTSVFLMVILPILTLYATLVMLSTIKPTDNVLLEFGKIFSIIVLAIGFTILLAKRVLHLDNKVISDTTTDFLNYEIMNKDGQVVRLYKLIDVENSRVSRILIDIREYRYFVNTISDSDEREVAYNSCKVPKLTHRDTYELIMTIQDVARLTEHKRIAEDEKQNKQEERRQQKKIERLKAKYQKANQFNKEDLDNMTDMRTLKTVENKIQNARKKEEKAIKSWLNDEIESGE